MLSLIGLVLSIGLADSMNPSTIAPGLYLALGKRATGDLIQFTLGVVAVNFLGGPVIVLGPGAGDAALVPQPHPRRGTSAKRRRGRDADRRGRAVAQAQEPGRASRAPVAAVRGQVGDPASGRRSAAVELPTAFPYFAAIAAIVGSGFGR